ncbi:MAG TPA: DUF2127 domain-containing protein [Polyangiales bacterium]|nr:DUF2127 domain-containing protein [Polyangiales bacterium]
MTPTAPREPALRLIIAYKLARAALAFGAAGVLLGFVSSGNSASLRDWAQQLRMHVASHWATVLAEKLVAAVTPHHVWLAATALGFDGALTLLEGWALLRGYTWGSWIVVLSSAALVPFEAVGLWHHPHAGRLILLLGNVAVALYLLWRLQRERK